MSTNAGICGFWGILLDQREEPEVKQLVEDINNLVASNQESDDEEIPGGWWCVDEHEDEINKEFFDRTVSVLQRCGIVVPEEACIIHTGSDDDRPCRCETWADQWGIGFGILMNPWEWPELHESFKEAGEFHTWVWMG